MSESGATPIDDLRQGFKAIPKDRREANQGFSIRVWRGLSWLERAAEVEDSDAMFIFRWLAFNAIYGRLDGDAPDAGDRGSWQGFLAEIYGLDTEDLLGQILRQHQVHVLRLLKDKYLFRAFWNGHAGWKDRSERIHGQIKQNYHDRQALPILQELFERLYVLRVQVFHGAATRGSKLNRHALRLSNRILAPIVPAMVEIMIDAGPAVDWGEACFSPVSRNAPKPPTKPPRDGEEN